MEVRDHRGKTPLMWAAAYGQTPTVGKLLQAGADVGARADECETALHLAASNGHHDVVRMLLNQVRTERERDDMRAWRYVCLQGNSSDDVQF